MIKPNVVYVSNESDVNDLSTVDLKNSYVVLSGESVLGDYSDGNIDRRSEGYMKGPTLKTSGGIPGVLLGGDRMLHLHLNQVICRRVPEQLFKSSRIHTVIELVSKLVRYTRWRTPGVVFIVSKSTSRDGVYYLIEELAYERGSISGFSERRVPEQMLKNSLEKYAKEAIKRFGEGASDVSVCGPEEESGYSALEAFKAKKLNDQLSILMRITRSAISQSRVDKTWLFAMMPVLAFGIALAMVQVAKGELRTAQREYASIMEISSLTYSKGRGPIELIERRAAYMQEVKASKEASFKLPVLLNAVASVRNQNPDLAVNVSELIYRSIGTAQYDYSIYLRFRRVPNLDPASELAAWRKIINQFSSSVPGEVVVQDTPVTTVDANGEAFLMLINGKFRPISESGKEGETVL